MSHDPQPPPVPRPLALALALAGDRPGAAALENAWRHRFAVGLARLAENGTTDPRAALEKLDACAADRFGRYNEENNRMPAAGGP